MTFDDLIAMQRVGEPQISPDGTRGRLHRSGRRKWNRIRVARNIWVVSTRREACRAN